MIILEVLLFTWHCSPRPDRESSSGTPEDNLYLLKHLLVVVLGSGAVLKQIRVCFCPIDTVGVLDSV